MMVIEPATAEFPRSDTAAMIQLEDGTLVIVYQKSIGGNAHDGGYKQIWSQTSSDGGNTWGNGRMLVDAAEGDIYAAAPSIVRLKSGAILMSCVGLTKDKTLTTQYLFRSDDNGKTFQPQGTIWNKDHRDASQGGAASMVQLASGRILLPVQCYLGPPLEGKSANRNAPRSAWCFYSDDEGRTWKESTGKVLLPKRGALEGSVAQLSDGRVIMSLRTQLGGPYLAWSTDQGETWSEAVFSGLEGGESCTVVRRVPGSDDLALIWNHSKYDVTNSHFGLRTPLTSALSHDGGKTWTNIRNIESEPAAEYTNLNCFFTKGGQAIVTYIYSDQGFAREQMPLRADIFDREWLYGHD